MPSQILHNLRGILSHLMTATPTLKKLIRQCWPSHRCVLMPCALSWKWNGVVGVGWRSSCFLQAPQVLGRCGRIPPSLHLPWLLAWLLYVHERDWVYYKSHDEGPLQLQSHVDLRTHVRVWCGSETILSWRWASPPNTIGLLKVFVNIAWYR